MAVTVDEIKEKYPLPTWQYLVQVGGEDFAFSEISGLNITHDVITYEDNLGRQHMPGRSKPVDITLKRGMVKGGTFLFDWIDSIKGNTVEKKDVVISLMDADMENPLVVWTLKNAFPKKLTAPGFTAKSNEVAIETLELMGDEVSMEYK